MLEPVVLKIFTCTSQNCGQDMVLICITRIYKGIKNHSQLRKFKAAKSMKLLNNTDYLGTYMMWNKRKNFEIHMKITWQFMGNLQVYQAGTFWICTDNRSF